ncbi:MAG: flagellar biosynthesis protein FlhB [Phycisphaeraceae bacterium]|nr:flagellar biosynthesis protein FlhB [Phycisphaeraceae bacterium]
MAEDLGERTELPTARRRQEARDEGRVAKSSEFAASVELIGAVILLAALGGFVMSGLGVLIRRALENQTPGDPVTIDSVKPLVVQAIADAAAVTGPIVLAMFVIAALSHYVQVGWHVTAEPLKPKFSRLNPAAGIKKFVNLRNLVKTALNCVKLVLIGLVAGLVIRKHLGTISALPVLGAAPALFKALLVCLELAAWLLILMLVLGIIDLIYQRWQFTRDIRMTRQEVKDERRSVDGDPDVKARRLRMARDIALQRLQHAVPKADVIVTNPTHFSVALQYDQDAMRAPKVIAKGADEMAFRIRQLAVANGIPMVERPPLARGLYWGVRVGQEIKPEFYEAVAEVLAYVYRLKEKAA